MSEQPEPNRRFQLHLADLIFVAVLVGIVGGFALPYLYANRAGIDPGPPYPTVAIRRLPVYAYVSSLIGVLGGALFVLIRGRFLGKPRWQIWRDAGAAGALLGCVFPFLLENVSSVRYQRYDVVGVVCVRGFCQAEKTFQFESEKATGIGEYMQNLTGRGGITDPGMGYLLTKQ